MFGHVGPTLLFCSAERGERVRERGLEATTLVGRGEGKRGRKEGINWIRELQTQQPEVMPILLCL